MHTPQNYRQPQPGCPIINDGADSPSGTLRCKKTKNRPRTIRITSCRSWAIPSRGSEGRRGRTTARERGPACARHHNHNDGHACGADGAAGPRGRLARPHRAFRLPGPLQAGAIQTDPRSSARLLLLVGCVCAAGARAPRPTALLAAGRVAARRNALHGQARGALARRVGSSGRCCARASVATCRASASLVRRVLGSWRR